jgi:HEPN domain-containing protein
MRDPDAAPWTAGVHLQQAAEKALKSLLLHHALLPPRTHDLDDLCERAVAVAPQLAGQSERLVGLTAFSVAERYPGADGAAVDLAGAFERVESLVAAVAEIVSAEGVHAERTKTESKDDEERDA